jgi:hypothetical protein
MHRVDIRIECWDIGCLMGYWNVTTCLYLGIYIHVCRFHIKNMSSIHQLQ